LGGDQVEGRQSVLELLRAERRPVRRVLMSDSLDSADILNEIEVLARRRHAPITYVSAAKLDREAMTEGHQGVIAHAAPITPAELDDLAVRENALLLVCDGITDPRNLGAMLRSAEGAGVTGIVMPRHRAARLTPAVTKTAAGAIEYLEFAHVGGIASAVDRLNKIGVVTVGLAGESKTVLYDIDLAGSPVALVVGGEQDGLSPLVRKRCAHVVSLPQRGTLSSLNASAAVSVALYEMARQRSR
jgi:23S rRNA (guanosine2251-2'-O)-methyltransferase